MEIPSKATLMAVVALVNSTRAMLASEINVFVRIKKNKLRFLERIFFLTRA